MLLNLDRKVAVGSLSKTGSQVKIVRFAVAVPKKPDTGTASSWSVVKERMHIRQTNHNPLSIVKVRSREVDLYPEHC